MTSLAARPATEGDTAGGVTGKVGAAFRLLMQVRMLLAPVTLLLLPRNDLVMVKALALVLVVVALSWIAGRYWELIVPRLLRHPLLVAFDVVLAFAILGFGGLLGPFFLLTMITATVAGLLYRWPGMLIVAAFQVLCYFIIFGFDQTIGPGGTPVTFDLLLGKPAFYPLAGFAGVGLRRLFDEQARQEAARRRAEIAATAAEERARLAREMHDSLAKTLRGIALSAAALPTWVRRDPARAREEAERIASAIEIASREARGLITGLRDDSVTQPLPSAVRTLAEKWGADTGVELRCDIDAEADLPLRARYEVLAIVSEVLTNIDRHAEASVVDVSLKADRTGVTLSVRDDGRGFAHEANSKDGLESLTRDGHYGLIGLFERAERIGARVTVKSAPGEGTVVTVAVPLEASSSADEIRLAEVG